MEAITEWYVILSICMLIQKQVIPDVTSQKLCCTWIVRKTRYGKPNGARFKKQNWLHVQQICYQGQDRFQSSSTKSIHVQPIFSQGQDIWNQAQQNNVVTFKKLLFEGKRYLSQAQEIT